MLLLVILPPVGRPRRHRPAPPLDIAHSRRQPHLAAKGHEMGSGNAPSPEGSMWVGSGCRDQENSDVKIRFFSVFLKWVRRGAAQEPVWGDGIGGN